MGSRLNKEIRTVIRHHLTELKPEPMFRGGKPVYKWDNISGETLLRSGEMDAEGRPGVPGFIYRAKVLCYEDHNEQMERAYRETGMKGITDYVDAVKRRQLERDLEATQAVTADKKLGRIAMIIDRVKNFFTYQKLKFTK